MPVSLLPHSSAIDEFDSPTITTSNPPSRIPAEHLLVAPIVPLLLLNVADLLRYKAHAASAPPLEPRLGIDDDDAVATCGGGLDELGVLFLEQGEGALGVPVPPRGRGEEQVHLLEGALVGLGVEGPDDGEGEDVDGAEDVEDLLVEVLEHDGEEQCLVVVNFEGFVTGWR